MRESQEQKAQPVGAGQEDAWAFLSSLEEKRILYPRDPHFREALWDAEKVFDGEPFPVLHAIALLVIKPEALAGRRVDSILNFLAEHDFEPVYIQPFAFTRHIVRELWRYQWNAATIEKMDLVDRVNCVQPTAMLLVRDGQDPRELPATVRLKSLKGAALPEERSDDSIRAALDSPNRMITFVHTADEPADLVREFGIFLDRGERRSLFETLRGQPPALDFARCRQQLKELEEDAPITDFNPDAAWLRICSRAGGQDRDALAQQRAQFQQNGSIDWWAFLALAEKVGAEEWDVLSICTAVVEHEDAGYAPTIKFDQEGIMAWLNGSARLCQ